MSMEMTPESTPGSSSAKRTRAKPKATTKPAAEAAVAKKPRAPRKTLTTKSAPAAAPEPADVESPPDAESPSEELGGMIATAAYYLAAARNFTPGHELDDWLEAERNIRARLYG
jgi:hypothetical protein